MNITMILWWIMVLGAVNVGLSALGFNLIETFLGTWPELARIVYLLIGASGVYYLLTAFSGGTTKTSRKRKK